MNCPACGRELSQMKVGEITVDVCRGGCGGIWFDKWELMRVDEKSEAAGEELVNIERDPNISVNKGKRRCPKCGDVYMMRHFFTAKQEIEVDECPKCGGFWLDAGELAAIRAQFESESDRKEAAEKLFNSMFGAKIEEEEAKLQMKRERAKKLRNMLKFLCPSYYIPGKQDWGAF